MSCSQLIEIEDLVLGTIEPHRARELRLHVEACTACRLEQAAVTKERALFTHREAASAGPSEALAIALRAQLIAEAADPATARARASVTGTRIGPARRGATRLVRRGASAVVRVLRRGHVSAACAALLFALVAFSKLGGAPILPAAGVDGASGEPANGPTASFFSQSFSQSLAEETLACSGSGSMTSFFTNDTLASAGATAQSSSSGATSREVLACGNGGERSGASCEPSVTCSSLRQ
jgi:hypothetical protein